MYIKVPELTEEQKKHYESIKWLISDGPRASGRTYLLAICFLQVALETGRPVKIWDHYRRGSQRDVFRFLMDIIFDIAAKNPHIIIERLNDQEFIAHYRLPEDMKMKTLEAKPFYKF